MKSTITKRKWQAIYRLLDKVSPIPYDCGTLCGAICCTCAEMTDQEMGIYLYPGEEKVHSRFDRWLKWTSERAEDYEFPDSWRGKVYFVKCKTPPKCPREKRPLQCRTFPLSPYLDSDGFLHLIYNYEELPYKCPLIEDCTKHQIDERFFRATYTVWAHLIRDPLIYDLVAMESRALDSREKQSMQANKR